MLLILGTANNKITDLHKRYLWGENMTDNMVAAPWLATHFMDTVSESPHTKTNNDDSVNSETKDKEQACTLSA